MDSTFVGLSAAEVNALRDGDPAIASIRARHASGAALSYAWLRSVVGVDRDLWAHLGRGTSILSSTQQLDQYLYSYGPMISCQWEEVMENMSLSNIPVRLVDYGCGQGLAGLIQYDKFGSQLTSKLVKVVIIEPSAVALVRAEAIYRCIAPNSVITCINKAFDQVIAVDLLAEPNLDSVHIFSNVLDVNGFDQFRLFGELMAKGNHTILAVSHDRDFDGGTSRMLSIKDAIEDPTHVNDLKVHHSEFKRFKCGPNDKYPAVSWHAKIEVINA